MPRKLSVKKERLGELTTDELHRVAGAAVNTTQVFPTLQLQDCVFTLHGCTTAVDCP